MSRYDAPMGPRINDRIRISPIRLIDQDGTVVGIVETDDARRRASELGLDLVEIAPDVRPPVCRIMDFGKYKYETAKKEKASKSRTKTSELKEVRLGRSMKIDPHDVEIRINQARRFLLEGHKVQIVQNFRGRELAHKSRGDARMEDIAQRLGDLGRVELAPRLNGKRLSMIISPDRTRIEAFKRKEASQQPATTGSAAVAPPADRAKESHEESPDRLPAASESGDPSPTTPRPAAASRPSEAMEATPSAASIPSESAHALMQ
ncbi:MAG: translation initiation factor IF-3 [Phycisphaeraceae bacterium]|nr:translation initiation factor IF-3 [Phycisphaeraceae bacterium]